MTAETCPIFIFVLHFCLGPDAQKNRPVLGFGGQPKIALPGCGSMGGLGPHPLGE